MFCLEGLSTIEKPGTERNHSPSQWTWKGGYQSAVYWTPRHERSLSKEYQNRRRIDLPGQNIRFKTVGFESTLQIVSSSFLKLHLHVFGRQKRRPSCLSMWDFRGLLLGRSLTAILTPECSSDKGSHFWHQIIIKIWNKQIYKNRWDLYLPLQRSQTTIQSTIAACVAFDKEK